MNEIIRTEPSQPAAEQPKPKEKLVVILPGESSSDMLRLLAWIFLIGGIAAGIYVIASLSEVPYRTYSTRKDPVIVGYGIGLIVTSIFMSVFSYALAAISDNVRVVAKNSVKAAKESQDRKKD